MYQRRQQPGGLVVVRLLRSRGELAGDVSLVPDRSTKRLYMHAVVLVPPSSVKRGNQSDYDPVS